MFYTTKIEFSIYSCLLASAPLLVTINSPCEPSSNYCALHVATLSGVQNCYRGERGLRRYTGSKRRQAQTQHDDMHVAQPC